MIDKEELKRIYPQFEDELLDVIVKNGIYQEFEADEVLMKTGQYFKSIILVMEGLVKLYREDEEGGEFLMYFIQPSSACALSMVCAAKNEASMVMAKTMSPTRVIKLPLSLMDDLMLKHKSWYHFVLETYRTRFEELLLTIDQIAFKALDERLEFHLKRLQENLKTNLLNVSHQDIAYELNTSREVISRLLKKLEQQGKVSLLRNKIEIIKL
jgi:CRP/FNR family transcriptional regulator, anaerobic regulatory protein